MLKVKEIIDAIEEFAPISLSESWDNPGLQVGNPDANVSAALLCLDVTEEVVEEAVRRECEMIISHHPLLFKGLKHIVGATPRERIVIEALRHGIAIYAAHTNLDSATDGISYEIAHSIGIDEAEVLIPHKEDPSHGLGVVGDIKPIPAIEFLRRVKDRFEVKALRYSGGCNKLVIRRVAVCGGAGAEFIEAAIAAGADAYVTGDVKYHDFTEHGHEILIADIGHYESELCSKKLFARMLHNRLPDLSCYEAQSDKNPIKFLI